MAHFVSSIYNAGNIQGTNKSIVGKMKDEYAGKVPSCFLGTEAKSCFVEVKGKATRKSKGVRKEATKMYLDRKHYEQIVTGESGLILCKMYVLRSYSHKKCIQNT